MTLLPAFALGAFTWSVAEYLIHRFVGHGPRREPPSTLWGRLRPAGLAGAFNDEHLRHHADAAYFAPTSQKIVAATVVGAVAVLLGTAVAGASRGAAFAGGLVLTYAAYEVLHRRIHTHGPRGRYGRWLRRHHLHHHYKTPRMNHGVTSSLWDVLLGTHAAPADGERLRVPQHLVPPWMLDESGEVRPEVAADYEVVRRPRRAAA